MRKRSIRDRLIVVGSVGILTGVVVLLVACDAFSIEKPQILTALWMVAWVGLGLIGARWKTSAFFTTKARTLCLAAFLILYYGNWFLWPKGTPLDEQTWAFSLLDMVFPLLIGSCFTLKDLEEFLGLLRIVCLALTAYILFEYQGIGDPDLTTGRYTVSEYLNPISQSYVVGLASIFSFARLLTVAGWWDFPLFLASTYAMLLGGSRGPTIALIAASLVIISLIGINRRGIWAAIAVVVMAWFASTYLNEQIRERLFSTETWLEDKRGFGVPLRVDRIRAALQIWRTHPVFGSGTAGNEAIAPYAHNFVAQILMETGIVGLTSMILFLWLSITPFIRQIFLHRKREWELPTLLAMIIYGLVQAQFAGTYMLLNFLWLPIGVAAAVGNMRKRPVGTGIS